ncbi:MAG: DUF2330 domain-containing protein [Nitrospinota bacterium]|nr:DUF2330 domain-containing protein [Nitrospinota bacterium]
MASLVVFTFLILPGSVSFGFPGFFVPKSGAKLINKSSVVIAAMDNGSVVMTVFADYKGPDKEFAMVIPIPGAANIDSASLGSVSAVNRIDLITSPTAAIHYDLTGICGNPHFKTLDMLKAKSYDYEEIFNDAARKQGKKRYSEQHAPAKGSYMVSTQGFANLDELRSWFNARGYKISDEMMSAAVKYTGEGKKFAIMEAHLDVNSPGDYRYLWPIRIQFDADTLALPVSFGKLNYEMEQDVSVILLSSKEIIGAKNYKPFSFTESQKSLPRFGGDYFAKRIGTLPLFILEQMPDFYQMALKHASGQKKPGHIFMELGFRLSDASYLARHHTVSRQMADELGLSWLTTPQSEIRRNYKADIPEGEHRLLNSLVTRFRLFPGDELDEEDPLFFMGAAPFSTQNHFVVEQLKNVPGNCKDEYIRYLKVRQGRHDEAISNLRQISGWSEEYISSRFNERIELAYWDLVEAIRNKDIAWAEAAVKREKLLDIQMSEALMMAASSGQQEVLKLLLANGADIQRRGRSTQTPLLAAAEAGHEELADYLLAHGADPDVETYGGETLLMFASAGGLTGLVEKLVEQGKDLEQKDHRKRTALFFAAEKGRKEIVQFLANHGAELNLSDRENDTPMSLALKNHHLNVVDTLRLLGGR